MKTPRPVKDPLELPLVTLDLPLGYGTMHALLIACCMAGIRSTLILNIYVFQQRHKIRFVRMLRVKILKS